MHGKKFSAREQNPETKLRGKIDLSEQIGRDIIYFASLRKDRTSQPADRNISKFRQIEF